MSDELFRFRVVCALSEEEKICFDHALGNRRGYKQFVLHKVIASLIELIDRTPNEVLAAAHLDQLKVVIDKTPADE